MKEERREAGELSLKVSRGRNRQRHVEGAGGSSELLHSVPSASSLTDASSKRRGL